MSSGIFSTASTARQTQSLISASGGTTANADKSRQTIAENFDAFLGLLTTQLKNQSPLDPLDANQFTQQLVQFSSVEQQLKTNDILTKLAEKIAGTDGANKLTPAMAAALVGKTVAADASKARLTQGANGASATWPLTTDRAFERAEITVYDDAGAPVFTTTRSIAPGQIFTWDGRSTNGQALTAGKTYQIAIRGQDGVNADSSPRWISVPTAVTGRVSAVDLSASDPTVTVGSRTILYSAITRIGE